MAYFWNQRPESGRTLVYTCSFYYRIFIFIMNLNEIMVTVNHLAHVKRRACSRVNFGSLGSQEGALVDIQSSM